MQVCLPDIRRRRQLHLPRLGARVERDCPEPRGPERDIPLLRSRLKQEGLHRRGLHRASAAQARAVDHLQRVETGGGGEDGGDDLLVDEDAVELERPEAGAGDGGQARDAAGVEREHGEGMGISMHVQECQRIAFEQKENQKLGNDPKWPDTPAGTPRSLRLSRRVRCVHTGHSGQETWSVARASDRGALRRSGN